MNRATITTPAATAGEESEKVIGLLGLAKTFRDQAELLLANSGDYTPLCNAMRLGASALQEQADLMRSQAIYLSKIYSVTRPAAQSSPGTTGISSDSSVLDQVPSQPLQSGAVSLPVRLACGGQAAVAVEVYALGRGVSIAGQGRHLPRRKGTLEAEANGQVFVFHPLGAAHTHRFVSAVEGDVAPIWQMVQAVNQKDHAELGNGVSAGAVGHAGTPLKTAILSLPQGMGKTTMAHQVARWLGCTAIVDGWNPGLAVLPGALHLTNCEVTA